MSSHVGLFYAYTRTSFDLMKENGFTLAKERSKRTPSQTITDEDYTDDIAFLANTPAKAESQLQSLEQTTGIMSPHVKPKQNRCALIKEVTSLHQRWSSETNGQVNLTQKQRLIYGK